jgi:anti-anti-sigma regulatory factor
VFDPVATLGLLRTEIAASRAEGVFGIRVVGDMSWASRRVPGADRLAWYEAQVNHIFTEGAVAGVCAYDRRRFDPLQLRRLSGAHPGAASTLLAYEPESSLRARRTRAPYGLRLRGEADLSNRDALRALLEHLFDDQPEATVDVSGLTFADVAAARKLVEAAAGGTVRMTGCSPGLVRLLELQGAAAVPGLTLEAG